MTKKPERKSYKAKKAQKAELIDARCRHLLRVIYNQNGPRGWGDKNGLVPFKKFAAMPAKEIGGRWDFPDRYLMHHIAKALAAWEENSSRYQNRLKQREAEERA